MASNLKYSYLNLKNNYAKDNKYLAVITENGIWIKDQVNEFVNIINANKLEYIGFDISKTYLDIAKKTFPNRKFVSMDIEKYNSILEHDISVCSATIEHLTNENLALSNILKATRNILILRTFLGNIYESDLYTKKQAKSSYPIKQFSFKNIALIAEKHGFHSKFIKDEATDSIPQYLGCGIIRTQYIAILKRV